jgi:hypothetical protein
MFRFRLYPLLFALLGPSAFLPSWIRHHTPMGLEREREKLSRGSTFDRLTSLFPVPWCLSRYCRDCSLLQSASIQRRSWLIVSPVATVLMTL